MKYHFKIHRERGGGFWAECVELEGCQTQGDSLEELRENMAEALNLHLSEPADSDVDFPLPKRDVKGRQIEAVKVDPKIAFAVQLRHVRRARKLTQTQAMKALDIRNLSAYQRLESPKRANPQLDTLARVKAAFPELDIDSVL